MFESNYINYEEVFAEFKEKHPDIKAKYYRPCCSLFDFPDIPNAIVVSLENEDKLIYIFDIAEHTNKPDNLEGCK